MGNFPDARTSMRMWAFGWLSSGRPALEHSVHGIFLCRELVGLSAPRLRWSQIICFWLPTLSVEVSLFAIRGGAKHKAAGEHDCSFGRGNEHLPGLLVLLFWPALGLEGQLEGHLFSGAGSNRPANGSSAFVGDGIIDDFNYFSFPGTEIERMIFISLGISFFDFVAI